MNQLTTIVIRSHNDLPLLQRTLSALTGQDAAFELIAFDNASEDGGFELLEQYAKRVFDVPAGSYVPGRVLNRAMLEASSDIVVFLNADCEPFDSKWLSSLLKPFDNPRVGAAFGRQLPRPDCSPLAAKDTEATYGDGSGQEKWRHCFSMANCAIRRSLWQAVSFSETLSYSEDIAWSWEIRKSGFDIRYVPEACVFHSHNYSNKQWRKRQYGEGRAEATIFTWSAWQRSFLRYSLLPTVRQVGRDVLHCLSNRKWSGLLDIPSYRLAQMLGRREGFLVGLREAEATPQWAHSVESL
jgi:rhamnosyltransferase